MSKHTPGPWVADWTRAGKTAWKVVGADGRGVSTVLVSQDRPAAEKEANARLIAAAPDLLEAAKDVTAMLELFADELRIKESADGISRQSDDAFRKLADLRAAIAKAEAE